MLVTGATGLLGGWLVRQLVDAGAEVTAVVRERPPRSTLLTPDILTRVRLVRADVRDQEAVQKALAAQAIDTVFHLAAQAIVGEANRDPVTALDVNVRGTWSVLEAVRHSPNVKAVIHASSDKAYGEHESLPYVESAALQGVHPYDVSKACSDLIARAYARTFEVPVAITRCGNFYGGGDLNWNRVVPGTIRSALCGERPVIRSDGKSVRDYFYVEDGASASLLLAEALHDRAELRGEAFNFSNELHVDVLALVRLILSRMDSPLEPLVRGEAPNEIQQQWLSAEKARRVLGWAPAYSLDEGLDRSIAWYRAHLTHD